MQQGNTTTVPWVFIIVGFLALFGSIGTAIHSWDFVKHAVRGEGKITAMREQYDRKDQSSTYAPTFQFRDASGHEHTVESHTSSYPPAHRVGDIVPVIYKPSEPDNARIDSFLYNWGLPTLFGIIGIVGLPVGLCSLYSRRRSSTGLNAITQ
jgi:hypothetical protein